MFRLGNGYRYLAQRGSRVELCSLFSSTPHGSAKAEQRRPKRKGEYLFGVAPCLAALQTRRRKVHAIFVKNTTEKADDFKRLATDELVQKYTRSSGETKVYKVDKATLERMSEKRPHQGIILDVDPLEFKEMNLSDLKLAGNNHDHLPLWLALDEIQDPMNMGAILRCAFFLGVDRIVATFKNCCPLTPVVSKASAGAMEIVQVYAVGSMSGMLKLASGCGWDVVGTCGLGEEGALSLQSFSLQRPTVLVIGNEGEGLRPSVVKACTQLVTIEPCRQLPPGFDSLNVAVATGILLHTLQRRASLRAH
ncbi:hypothetical protein EMCRGX_G024915 [Ephydatia muelleri]|eukprot:Em0015g1053a